MLKDYLSSFAPQLHGHVELRAQISTSHAVAMLNGDLAKQCLRPAGRCFRPGVPQWRLWLCQRRGIR